MLQSEMQYPFPTMDGRGRFKYAGNELLMTLSIQKFSSGDMCIMPLGYQHLGN